MKPGDIVRISRPEWRNPVKTAAAAGSTVSIWSTDDPELNEDDNIAWIKPTEFAIFIHKNEGARMSLVFVAGIIGYVNSFFITQCDL